MEVFCFIASVIKDDRRLRYFRYMLDSIRAQTMELSHIYISIHIDPLLIKSDEEWKALFSNLPGKLVILRQRRAKRQFVQLRELYYRAEKSFTKESFVIFSDDDDLWHRDRVAAYVGWYTNAQKMNPSALSTIASVQAVEETKDRLPCERCRQHSERDVDAMLRCGCITIELYEANEANCHHCLEYHESAVRPHVMKDFFERHVELVETNRFADMQFRDFVRRYKPHECFTGTLFLKHWLYYYRKCDSTYDAVTRPMRQEETAEYVQYLKEMVACPAMGSDAAKKCIHRCDPMLWPILMQCINDTL
jgi:hypothetical protein